MTRAAWRRDIQKALIDLGLTNYRLAAELKVSPQWIYQVLNGDATSGAKKDWEKKISLFCGVYYPEEGLEDEEEG